MAKHRQALTRTRQEAAAWLDHNGISAAEFARAHGFSRMTIVDLLRGKRVGRRGEAHNAAIALGMKLGKPRPVEKHLAAASRQ